MQSLAKKISAKVSTGEIPLLAKRHIKGNLNPKFKLRPYQIEAFARFDFQFDKNPKSRQLLFQMATGSGKTLVMAGLILDLYERGYRNFIFFVNSSNIIEKTRDNFLNSLSAKYLFNQTLSIAGKQIKIKEVDNFETANQENINIVFTTIQGLHTSLNTPRENALTYEDFEDKKIILLSDEAHHINSATKKGKQSKDESQNLLTWEGTVNKIFNSNPKNLLLEFTATADIKHAEIAKKYQDKILFDYSLRQFRNDKYSKEVQVLQAELNPFERTLQAVILSQYRRKVFASHQINIKPVLLLKSKTIGESKKFFEEFVQGIETLSPKIIDKIRNNTSNKTIEQIFVFFDKNKITIPNLILELQEDFSENKCISVDSKNDSVEKQLIINSLEDKNNEFRVIFAVDKLNEGWDVLNLFDIVRLYNTKNTVSKSRKVSQSTLSEAQLIGRGARYCPFRLNENQPLFQRKFDETEHELQICEELYYHSEHNPAYIWELNRALQEIGLKEIKTAKKKYFSKDKVEQSAKKTQKPEFDIYKLDKSIRDKVYKKKLFTGFSSLSNAFESELSVKIQKTKQVYNLNSFSIPILAKAINKLPFYRFDNLQKHFPHLKSISELLSSDDFLNKIKVEIETSLEQNQNLSNEEKLETTVAVFDEISKLILLSKNL